MSIEATISRCYYDQDGNRVHGIWASEQHTPRISAAFHANRDHVTIAYDLIYTRKRLSQKGRMLVHAIFQAASGEQHYDSPILGMCAGADEGEDRRIPFDQADAIAKAIAAVLYTHLINQEAWQHEGKAHETNSH
jgi:hypothetical protein